MGIIQIVVIVFLLIMLGGFIAALSDKKDHKEQRDGKKQSRVIVTQQVPSVFDRRKHRR